MQSVSNTDNLLLGTFLNGGPRRGERDVSVASLVFPCDVRLWFHNWCVGRVSRPMSEADLQRRVQVQLCHDADVRLWRNNVGEAWQGQATRLLNGDILIKNPRRVRYGLATGSSDLIGLRSLAVTEAMVGSRVAVFTSLEFKRFSGRATADQGAWIRMVNALGGRAGITRNFDDGRRIIYD